MSNEKEILKRKIESYLFRIENFDDLTIQNSEDRENKLNSIVSKIRSDYSKLLLQSKKII